MKARSLLAGLLGVTLAAALVTWAVQRAGGTRFLQPLSEISLWVIGPALLCEAFVQVSKAWKWTGLLQSIRPVRLRSALGAVLIGGAATHVVPLRLDELLRARVLGSWEEIPSATVLATVAVDRIIEILMLGTLLGVIALLGTPPGILGTALQVAWIGFCGGAVVLFAFVFAEERASAVLQKYRGPGSDAVVSLVRLARDMARGLRALPSGAALGKVVIGTLGEWSATVVMYGLVLAGFGLTTSPIVPLTLAVGGAAAYGVPNVPGAIGTFEAAQVSILEQLLSLPPEQALALAVAAHAVLTIPVTIAGAGVALSMWLRSRA